MTSKGMAGGLHRPSFAKATEGRQRLEKRRGFPEGIWGRGGGLEHFKFFYTIAKLRFIRQPKAGSIVVRTVRCAARATQRLLFPRSTARALHRAVLKWAVGFCEGSSWPAAQGAGVPHSGLCGLLCWRPYRLPADVCTGLGIGKTAENTPLSRRFVGADVR
jgi:hypothetical protein